MAAIPNHLNQPYTHRDGNGTERDQMMESSSPPHMILSYPIPNPSYLMGKTFSPHPRPLGPHKAPPHPVQPYFLLTCPTTNTIFLIKPISLIKIYLKL